MAACQLKSKLEHSHHKYNNVKFNVFELQSTYIKFVLAIYVELRSVINKDRHTARVTILPLLSNAHHSFLVTQYVIILEE